jgi:hypothetical protein
MAAPKKNKNAIGNKGGRPSLYKDEYADLAYKYCLLGATDEELSLFFDVHIDTLYQWKKDIIEFSEAVTRGKAIADAEVANSFHKRATGFEVDSEEIAFYQGTPVRAKTKTYYPPDAGAALNWLKNRQPKKWRDKQEIEHSGNINDKPDLSKLSVEELKTWGALIRKTSK